MINKRIAFLALGFSLLSLTLEAQDRFAIKYKYKPQSAFELDSPLDFLTEGTLQRRAREKVSLDSLDLPVSPAYIETITPLVEKVHYHTKWLNASIVVASEEQVEEVKALPFVEDVELVGRGFYDYGQTARKEALKIPIKIRLKSKSDKAYMFQNELLGIPEMHEEGYTGEGVTIAVFDGGFQNADRIDALRHLFDNGRITATRDFVIPGSDEVFRTDTHGTGSLSLIAAFDPNSLVAGAYNANYILAITEDVSSEYRIEEYNWVRAAEYADSLGVDIINSSLGYNLFNESSMNYSKEDLDGKTAVITRGANIAAEKGILIVSSAGNEGNGSWKTITAPSDANGILSVGAVTNNLQKSNFSSIGPTADGRTKPEVTALGSSVTLWRNNSSIGTASGTSFSAPQVAALAAGLWEAKPELSKAELLELILSTSSQADEPDNNLGYGIPNFTRAYFGVVTEVEKEIEEAKLNIFPNPTDGNELFINYGRLNECEFSLYDLNGKLLSSANLNRNSFEQPYSISVGDLRAGMYIIQVRESNKPERIKFVKK
ncbi:S8 family serine peptidase [Litoribacter ruber]|uniref:S8 family serine peptidase n=1 Tax=Litoribacter ruber TaxID=702568 RepID=A0AAP2CJY0_9BACT|nr:MULTISPECIES: S8 family serine peptidase [Litoribacter]MBS9524591.1 S8 family serine peptidase [Litoribacter alkaliphilus]MBT0810249.1 S8 family serine peptidase [Litoribacter ruber]